MTHALAILRSTLGVLLVVAMTRSTAQEAPAAVACPCADVFAAARAEYEKHPGPTFCQSAHVLPPDEWNSVSLNATKKELTGSKWRRVYLDMAVWERCKFNIPCAKCTARVSAEKKYALYVHELYGESRANLSEPEMTACRALIRTLDECGRPYERSSP